MADRYEEKARAVADAIGDYSRSVFGGNAVLFSASKAVELIAAALRDQDAWRPIETAPKDGTQILTWGRLHDDGGIDMGEQPRVRVSNWSPTYNCWYSACSGSHAPTFWRHIPAPPPDTGRGQG